MRDALLEICAESPDRLVVDLSGVRFIDSTALGVLIEARTKLANRRGFLLAAPGLEVGKLLRQVREDVLAATSNQQEPMFAGDLPAEDVFFRPPQ